MKISLEWISDFVDIPAGVSAAELAHQLTLKTVEVENVIDTGAALAHVIVARIVLVGAIGDKGHHLAVCDLGKGHTAPVVSRLSNIREGMLVAVALPGARLASNTGDVDAEVGTAQVAGTVSEGFVCTAADLRLQRLFSPSHPTEALDLSELDVTPGTSLAQALSFSDTVLEIDNKSLTNRPDLWGHYGIARELAAIYRVSLRRLTAAKRPSEVDTLISDVDASLCGRISAIEFSLADDSAATPLWIRSRLARIGESSVNLCVDLSNYVMFTVGQPTHAYDADRITLPLSVTRAGATTKLDLLAGETREIGDATPVIKDAKGIVGIAGVMGLTQSAVAPATRRFVLEVASFWPQPIRRASQDLALRTEASARFEKGLDTQRVDVALALFLNTLTAIASRVSVTAIQDVEPQATQQAHLETTLDFLTTRIGTALPPTEITDTLGRLGFAATIEGQRLHVVAPTWRSTGDISLPHDVVEEIARIHGYDQLQAAPLTVTLAPVRQLNRKPLDRVMREQLATRAGLQEVVTYPWVADQMLAAVGLDKAQTVRFEGAPSPDRDSLRPTLIPGLLEAIAGNLRYASAFGLFEIGTVFQAGEPAPFRGVFEPMPPQTLMLTAILVGDDGRTLFRRAKGLVEMLQRHCHLTDVEFADAPWPVWLDSSARLGVSSNGTVAGVLGLLGARCRRLAGIDKVHVACFEIDLSLLAAHRSRENTYEPISELPEAEFDLSVVAADEVSWAAIERTVRGADELIHRVMFVEEFRGSWVPAGHRSVTLHATLRPQQTTLTAGIIGQTRTAILAKLEQDLGTRLRA